MTTHKLRLIATAAVLALPFATPAQADDATPAAVTLPMPAMTGPLAANTSPQSLDLGDAGKIYVTGAVTALAYTQNNPSASDRHSALDLDNGQLFVQKTDGMVQFFLQAGVYSIPVIGTPYVRASRMADDTYGAVPQGYLKLAPTSDFSIMAGKLPTMFGAEYTFSFENMNIQRGLLWNQENDVNRGVQANYAAGPLAFALSLNDGFYSNRYSWLNGSATYTINSTNTIAFVGGGNMDRNAHSSFATPVLQNNSQIYNLIYTYNSGAWTVNPYLQYTFIPKDAEIGTMHDASTYGAAVLAKYSFDTHYSLAGRVEYIDTTGSVANGSPNLLYGSGSNAWTFTLTPSYQYKQFFGRAEASYVVAGSTAAGAAFGDSGNDKSQGRFLLETGILF